MTRPVAILRPEPGNDMSARRVATMGLVAIRLPLFAVHPLDWTPPEPAHFDALVLTSGNAPRHAGPALARYAELPVYTVGAATARAARAAGLHVTASGGGDLDTLFPLLASQGVTRALHLAGWDRTPYDNDRIAQAVAVYASDPVDPPPGWSASIDGAVALVHSQRAAARLAALVGVNERASIRLATISAAVADAAGPGWDRIATATRPDEDSLLAVARRLAD